MYFGDATYILVLIGAALSLAASGYLKSTFSKYSRVRCSSGLTGAEAAARILKNSGIDYVKIERIAGNLTDHYDPRKKVLRLSESVYDSSSIAAVGVAAHECGHAIQDSTQYAPLKMRSLLVPVATIGSQLGMPLVFIGFILGLELPIGLLLLNIGIIAFGIAVLFQIVTLPVEFNASSRALNTLGDYGIMGSEEVRDGSKVLTAAALTYVAAAAAAVLQLLRLIMLRNRRS
ncbi:MAG: zinc metallopeptidase [Lachnospiraceae bacterium]|nr:zinc metallopeptidase [Lachnospiraceae bacterium]